MIIHGSIEILSVSDVSNVIIFGALDVEIGDPAEFSVDVSILGDVRVIREPGTLDLIELERIVLPFGLEKIWLLLAVSFIKELFVVSMVSFIEESWTDMMSLVPHFVRGCEHAIIGVLINNHLNSGLGIGRVGSSHASLLFEDASEPITTQWGLTVNRCNGWSELWINYNVFSVGHIYNN